jgi:hypothetical protein
MRASGAGGQHVNTTDSAVRITHLPSGIVVTSSEKSQHRNREIAMAVLRARLYDLERTRAAAERAADRKAQVGSGDRSERIRTYNFPQGRLTDHRINLTLYRLSDVMQGDLDEVIDALTEDAQAACWRRWDHDGDAPRDTGRAARVGGRGRRPDPQRDARRLHDWALRKGGRDRPQSALSPGPSTSAPRGCRSPASSAGAPSGGMTSRSRTMCSTRGPTPKPWWRSRWGPFRPVLDLGTGSGCILLSLLAERPGASGTGTDISDAALATARRTRRGWGSGATFLRSDWFAGGGTLRPDRLQPALYREADYRPSRPRSSTTPADRVDPGGRRALALPRDRRARTELRI